MTPNEIAPKKNGRTKLAAFGILAVCAIAGVLYYMNARRYESTDNAFIDGDIIQVSPRVPGQVARVLVTDNQRVSKGELLVELDANDYEARLAEARAKLADTMARASTAQSNLALTSTVTGAVLEQAGAGFEAAREQVEVLKARLAQDAANVQATEASTQAAEARVKAVEAEAARAAADAGRYRTLFAKDEISKQALDRAETDARATAANLEAARQSAASTKAQLAQSKAAQTSTTAMLRQTERQVRQAEGRFNEAKSAPIQVRVRQSDVQALKAQIERDEAAVRQAELALSYTKVTAPDAGYVTRKATQAGNVAAAGQILMAIVSDRLWVVANFKETQLANMRPGQPVDVRLDAYPQLKLEGKVESIQSGSGARFSLMPPENATGNYVKVVQRVPVRIALTSALPAQYRVGPGMSVVPEVRVQ